MIDEELRLNVPKQSVDERLVDAIEIASLKFVSLEERRREASKPLYLTRYE